MIKDSILYYNGDEIETDYSSGIIDNILKLHLKIGDSIELFPFNYFDDGNTSHKGKKQIFHTKLKIKDVKISMIETWNRRIKNKIEIYLEDNNN